MSPSATSSGSLQIIESFRLWDENDFEYGIFSILSIAPAQASVIMILAGKRYSRRHCTASFSENVVVAGTSYQMLTWDQALFSFRFENYIPAGSGSL